jgi:hypothetical protein
MKAAESDDTMKITSSKKAPAAGAMKFVSLMVPKVSQSKLKDLAWNLDIQERINSGEATNK